MEALGVEETEEETYDAALQDLLPPLICSFTLHAWPPCCTENLQLLPTEAKAAAVAFILIQFVRKVMKYKSVDSIKRDFDVGWSPWVGRDRSLLFERDHLCHQAAAFVLVLKGPLYLRQGL